MPSKLNSEFNYRTQVIGETPWEKIKTLKGFLEGRVRAASLEIVGEKKYLAQKSKLQWLKDNNKPEHKILELEGKIIEIESTLECSRQVYALNQDEIHILEKLLKELFLIAEPTRIEGYSDDQMFESNAMNEFTVWIAKEIQAEIIANGRPSGAKIRNAMSCPESFIALQRLGLIPSEIVPIMSEKDVLQIEEKANQ